MARVYKPQDMKAEVVRNLKLDNDASMTNGFTTPDPIKNQKLLHDSDQVAMGNLDAFGLQSNLA